MMNLGKLPKSAYIFAITCTKCKHTGVYHASNVHADIQQLIGSLHHDTTDDPLYHHFHWHGHAAISITLLEDTPITRTRDLTYRLNHWIDRLNTLTPNGFNDGYHRLHRRIPLLTPHFPGTGQLLKETTKALQHTGLDKTHNISVFAVQRGGRNLTQHLVRAQHKTDTIEPLSGHYSIREQPIPKPSTEIEALTWINTARQFVDDVYFLPNQDHAT